MAITRPSLSKTLLQMELNRFYEKPVTRVAAGLVLSILCIAFFAVAAIKPTLETMAQLIKQIEEKKEVDQKLTVKINALSTGQRELTQKSQAASVIDTAIPATPDYDTLLLVIEKLATEHGILLTGFTATSVPLERSQTISPTEAGTLESLPFTLSAAGSYEQLIAFVRDLQNLQRIILIDRFDITRTHQDQESRLLLSVSARAFAFQKKIENPSDATPEAKLEEIIP